MTATGASTWWYLPLIDWKYCLETGKTVTEDWQWTTGKFEMMMITMAVAPPHPPCREKKEYWTNFYPASTIAISFQFILITQIIELNTNYFSHVVIIKLAWTRFFPSSLIILITSLTDDLILCKGTTFQCLTAVTLLTVFTLSNDDGTMSGDTGVDGTQLKYGIIVVAHRPDQLSTHTLHQHSST